MKKVKDKKKLSKNKQIALILTLVIGIEILVFASLNIYKWFTDSNKTKEMVDDIGQDSNVVEVNDDNAETIDPGNIDESNPYWDYIRMKLIDVDFTELEKTNNEVKGWIQVSGTNINYPFVQHSDNDYYLTRSFDKKYNDAGWVFLDYRNNIESLDKNTILYAHSRLDKTMFGSLKNLLKTNWYKDVNNHIIKLSTKNQNTMWQVFSLYHIPTTSDYLQIKFSSDTEFKNFADMLQKRSVYKFNTTVNEHDKILTLSTCYHTDEKMVMHAKLIKYANK